MAEGDERTVLVVVLIEPFNHPLENISQPIEQPEAVGEVRRKETEPEVIRREAIPKRHG
jgi:hypothetical protein